MANERKSMLCDLHLLKQNELKGILSLSDTERLEGAKIVDTARVISGRGKLPHTVESYKKEGGGSKVTHRIL